MTEGSKKMVKKQEVTEIGIIPIKIKDLTLRLVGDSPLIVHAWSDKAKKEMRDKQMKKAKGPRPAKDPEAEYEGAFYRLPDGRPAFPTIAFKAAAVAAAIRFTEGLKGTEVRGAFHIDGELVPIEGEPVMREDMVRVQTTTDIRYRPEFKTWSVNLLIRYNADKISPDQIANLFNAAGFGVGVGEWRPEKTGSNGMFHVEL